MRDLGTTIRDLKNMDKTVGDLFRQQRLRRDEARFLAKGQEALNEVIPALERMESKRG